MHRFFVPPDQCAGDSVTLSERESRHAVRVLRLAAGDPIEILDGEGRCLSCQVIRVDRRGVVAEVLSRSVQPKPPVLHLAPALLKGWAMDLLLQKATELGATSLSPLITARTVVRVDPAEAEAKVEGWRATMLEACKQCGNAWLPRIEAPAPLDEFLVMRGSEILFAALLGREDALLPGEALGNHWKPSAPLTVLTGPEGDFTPQEQDALLAAGAVPITLGPRILRAETAVIAALAIFQHEIARRGPRLTGPDATIPANSGSS